MKILNLKIFTQTISDKQIENYLKLLSQLTTVYNDHIELNFMINTFRNKIKSLSDNTFIFICMIDDKIIGSGTLIVENKIIHKFGKVGHLEDIIIDSGYRGCGFGKDLINYLIDFAKNLHCYKVILDCNEENVNFYQKCTPQNCTFKKANQISYYFN